MRNNPRFFEEKTLFKFTIIDGTYSTAKEAESKLASATITTADCLPSYNSTKKTLFIFVNNKWMTEANFKNRYQQISEPVIPKNQTLTTSKSSLSFLCCTCSK